MSLRVCIKLEHLLYTYFFKLFVSCIMCGVVLSLILKLSSKLIIIVLSKLLSYLRSERTPLIKCALLGFVIKMVDLCLMISKLFLNLLVT